METTIYAYTKDNQAYIGKTKNLTTRKWDHKKRFNNWDYKELDTIYSVKYEDWKPYECAWIELYKSWGYELINKNKGGGGRPGIRTKKDVVVRMVKWAQEHDYVYHKQWVLSNPNYDSEYRKTPKNKAYRKEYQKQYYLNKKQQNGTIHNNQRK